MARDGGARARGARRHGEARDAAARQPAEQDEQAEQEDRRPHRGLTGRMDGLAEDSQHSRGPRAQGDPSGDEDDGAEEPEEQTKRLNPILVRRMQDRGEELEEEIARAEAEISSCELELANFRSAEESIRLTGRIEELRHAIKEMLREWEQIELVLSQSAGQS